MQHPFEGVMKAGETAETRPTRRSLLVRTVGAVAAFFGLSVAASAQTVLRPTTRAFGEEGGASTFAWGEEGGRATTFALGEEGGWPQNRWPTTYALGEEGGWRPPVQRPTTLAFGEEGGATTFALGEEGGRI